MKWALSLCHQIIKKNQSGFIFDYSKHNRTKRVNWMGMSDAGSEMLAVHVWDGMGWETALLSLCMLWITEPGPCLLGRAGQDPSTWLGTEVAVKPSASAWCWVLRKHSAYCMEQDSLMDLDLHLINQFTHCFNYPNTPVFRL